MLYKIHWNEKYFDTNLFADTDWFEPIALGMESRLIVDAQLAVSSFNDSLHGRDEARLDVNATIHSIINTYPYITVFNATFNITSNITNVKTFYIKYGGWIAAEDDIDPWLQVDFRTNVTVSSLLTQGLDSNTAWVTRFTLAYAHEKDDWNDYKINGLVKVKFIFPLWQINR